MRIVQTRHHTCPECGHKFVSELQKRNEAIAQHFKDGMRQIDIARQYGLSAQAIRGILIRFGCIVVCEHCNRSGVPGKTFHHDYWCKARKLPVIANLDYQADLTEA